MVLLIGVGAEEHHTPVLQVLVGYPEAHDPGPEVPLGHQVMYVYANVTQTLYPRHAGHLPIALRSVLVDGLERRVGPLILVPPRRLGVMAGLAATGPSP